LLQAPVQCQNSELAVCALCRPGAVRAAYRPRAAGHHGDWRSADAALQQHCHPHITQYGLDDSKTTEVRIQVHKQVKLVETARNKHVPSDGVS
jgi:hypothetical protein